MLHHPASEYKMHWLDLDYTPPTFITFASHLEFSHYLSLYLSYYLAFVQSTTISFTFDSQ